MQAEAISGQTEWKNWPRAIATLVRTKVVETIIVSSGAVGLGMGKLGIEERPKDLSSPAGLCLHWAMPTHERMESIHLEQAGLSCVASSY